MSSIAAVLIGALAGYLFAMRLNTKQRQHEQWWKIYLSVRVLETLDSNKYENMPKELYLKHWDKHREIVLQNLVRSGLPEMKEILRAVNPMGFPDIPSRHQELRRLGLALLKRLDPDYAEAARQLEAEWGPLKEGDFASPESATKPPAQ